MTPKCRSAFLIPFSSTDEVTKSAQTFSSSLALPIATPTPASRMIEIHYLHRQKPSFLQYLIPDIGPWHAILFLYLPLPK